MQPDKRCFPRFSVRKGVAAEISSNDLAPMHGVPIDMSLTGAYIASIRPGIEKARVKFEIFD